MTKTPAPPNPWSDKDVTYLRNSYGVLSTQTIAANLGRNLESVRNKLKRLMINNANAAAARPQPTGQPTSQPTAPKHLARGRPAPLRANGLHDIVLANTSNSGKVLISPIPSQSELLARRKSERLELASSTRPIRNSTVTEANPYHCPELQRNPGLPDARFVAFTLPSRVGGRLYYPDGRVEAIKP